MIVRTSPNLAFNVGRDHPAFGQNGGPERASLYCGQSQPNVPAVKSA